MKIEKKLVAVAVALIFSLTSLVPMYAQGIWGDVSGDGSLTALDSALILEQVLSGGILDDDALELGKVSGEAELSINDAALVLKKVLNFDIVFPAEQREGQTTTIADVEGTSEETTAEAIEGTSEETTFGEAYITLEDGNSVVSGAGVSIDGDDLVISQGGIYYVSGKLSDGKIVVNSENDVEVVFNGVEISSSKGSPFYSLNGDVDLKLQKGTENVLTDAETYSDIDADGEPDACLFGKDRITIKGAGSLTVNAKYGDGIASKDEIKIKNANRWTW